MFVSKSMTRKVITIDKDAGILEGKELMEKYHIRHLPVVEADNLLIGIVSDRDMRSAVPYNLFLNSENKDLVERISKLKIKDIMTKDPISVSTSYTIQDALLLIQKTQVGAFPVVDDQGKLQGIVSVRDLLRAFINVLGIGEPGTLLCIIAEDKIGQRVFDIKLQGNVVAENFDILKTAGKPNKAVIRQRGRFV